MEEFPTQSQVHHALKYARTVAMSGKILDHEIEDLSQEILMQWFLDPRHVTNKSANYTTKNYMIKRRQFGGTKGCSKRKLREPNVVEFDVDWHRGVHKCAGYNSRLLDEISEFLPSELHPYLHEYIMKSDNRYGICKTLNICKDTLYERMNKSLRLIRNHFQ